MGIYIYMYIVVCKLLPVVVPCTAMIVDLVILALFPSCAFINHPLKIAKLRRERKCGGISREHTRLFLFLSAKETHIGFSKLN